MVLAVVQQPRLQAEAQVDELAWTYGDVTVGMHAMPSRFHGKFKGKGAVNLVVPSVEQETAVVVTFSNDDADSLAAEVGLVGGRFQEPTTAVRKVRGA